MIPIGQTDGHGASTAKQRNNTPTKRMSVGVKKPRAPCTMLDFEKPALTVTATNNNPIRVAAAVPAITKKLSQPWSTNKQCSPSAVYDELREPEVIVHASLQRRSRKCGLIQKESRQFCLRGALWARFPARPSRLESRLVARIGCPTVRLRRNVRARRDGKADR